MQTLFHFASNKRLPEILTRLTAVYGAKRQRHDDPLEQLIFSVVGEKTPGAVALARFHHLRQVFPRWSDIRDASPDALIPTLRGVADFARKATILPQILRAIEKHHGLLDLDFLADYSVEAARQWLEALPGVSSLSVAATLNFSSLHKTILMVDDDSARVLRRLRLVSPSAPRSALDRLIVEIMPAKWRARETRSLYFGLSRLGRALCHQGRPECKTCCLATLCPTAKQGSATLLNFPSDKERQLRQHSNANKGANKKGPTRKTKAGP